jgi:hypothetical protein
MGPFFVWGDVQHLWKNATMTLERDNPIRWYVYYSGPKSNHCAPYRTREDALANAPLYERHGMTLIKVQSSDGKVTISSEEILRFNSEQR